MSGSSMDGVDLAYCELNEENGKWSYDIKQAETIPYNEKWRVRLSQLRKQSPIIYAKTHTFYGHYLGQLVKDFCQKHSLQPDFVSSHGHTIFHDPESMLTAQVGDGAAISAISGLPVVCDFRSVDAALGGQGAPLVAIGDRLLFGEYDFCLNLGGFANLSCEHEGKRIAFDVAPANIPLNRIAREFKQDYDKDGEIAARGKVDYQLLQSLNELPFYSKKGPKSLAREWINREFWPVMRESEANREDKMKTLCDHIGKQIGENIEELAGSDSPDKKVLITGGGAYNKTLIDHIQTHTDIEVVIPDEKLVEYKEALVFAFLGVLRVRNEVNCLAASTGASHDNIGGAIYGNYTNLN